MTGTMVMRRMNVDPSLGIEAYEVTMKSPSGERLLFDGKAIPFEVSFRPIDRDLQMKNAERAARHALTEAGHEVTGIEVAK